MFNSINHQTKALLSKVQLSLIGFFFMVFVSVFGSVSAMAMDIRELERRYPWVDSYKYIENHSDVQSVQAAQLMGKVSSLKQKIEQFNW